MILLLAPFDDLILLERLFYKLFLRTKSKLVMFVFCGVNFNNKHFLWIFEGKISKYEVEGEEFAP